MSLRLALVLSIALSIGASAGCTIGLGVRADVDVPPPTLVAVSPGVWVVEDYHEPVFYSDNFYWRYYGGVWYRSTIYSGSWVRVRPPRHIVSIRSPGAYVRYHRRGNARVRRGPHPRSRQPSNVRDHRRPANRSHRAQPRRAQPRRAQPRRAQPRNTNVRDHRSAPKSDRSKKKKKKDERVRDHRK